MLGDDSEDGRRNVFGSCSLARTRRNSPRRVPEHARAREYSRIKASRRSQDRDRERSRSFLLTAASSTRRPRGERSSESNANPEFSNNGVTSDPNERGGIGCCTRDSPLKVTPRRVLQFLAGVTTRRGTPFQSANLRYAHANNA